MRIHVLSSGSHGNCYLIDNAKDKLLIEAGIPFRKIQEKLWSYGVQVSDLSGCLVSHSHKDHSKAVKNLLKAGVDCYMNPETANKLDVMHYHRVSLIYRTDDEKGFPFKIGSWHVQSFSAIHQNTDGTDAYCLGFVLDSGGERLVYLNDSAYAIPTFPGTSVYMLGANYDLSILNANIATGIVDRAAKSRILRSHASLNTIKEMLRVADKSKLKEVWLLHLSSRNADADLFKREIASITGVPVYVG